ncbi:MAG: hypothetical protein DRP09_17990 [Candidatus Thorarchaeota archaeon]|nr:MAG: hypothetical protein DRP09_17990 [Candidatus Thorarchaeota archaeon]
MDKLDEKISQLVRIWLILKNPDDMEKCINWQDDTDIEFSIKTDYRLNGEIRYYVKCSVYKGGHIFFGADSFEDAKYRLVNNLLEMIRKKL